MITLTLRSLARTALLGVAALALTTAAADRADAQSYKLVPRDTVAQNVYQGWKQYELNCSRCHGEGAVGSSFAPALTISAKDDGTVPNMQEFVTVVCAGRKEKGMPAWCELGLEMEKIQNIYAYVKGRADGKIVAPTRPAVKPEG